MINLLHLFKRELSIIIWANEHEFLVKLGRGVISNLPCNWTTERCGMQSIHIAMAFKILLISIAFNATKQHMFLVTPFGRHDQVSE